MGLANAYVGEGEISAVADRIEPEVGITGTVDADEKAVFLSIFATLVEAVFAAQASANATVRLGELMLNAAGDRVAPVCSQFLMDLASKAPIMRNEILQAFAGLTTAELRNTDGNTADLLWEDLTRIP